MKANKGIVLHSRAFVTHCAFIARHRLALVDHSMNLQTICSVKLPLYEQGVMQATLYRRLYKRHPSIAMAPHALHWSF